jgi:hypothetical protein
MVQCRSSLPLSLSAHGAVPVKLYKWGIPASFCWGIQLFMVQRSKVKSPPNPNGTELGHGDIYGYG